MSTQTLVREDWNNISKLTFKDAEPCQIIEVKVIESFIGVKPFPVVVVIKTLANDIVARQYSLDGICETMKDDFQIVKVPEPEPINYEEIVKELMIKGVFVSQYKKLWYKIRAIDDENKEFLSLDYRHKYDEIRSFFFSFDLKTFYNFNTYLTLRGKS